MQSRYLNSIAAVTHSGLLLTVYLVGTTGSDARTSPIVAQTYQCCQTFLTTIVKGGVLADPALGFLLTRKHPGQVEKGGFLN